MQDEHAFVWKAMLDTIDVDVTGTRVLDAGCNRGGFLRRLCDECGIAEGSGYDPASGAIDDARRLAGSRSLTFEVADTVPVRWQGFDVAFSHEVLYLLHDLSAHANAIYRALAPGGVYYAVIGVHAASPLVADWHRTHAEELQLPDLYSVDDVARAFGAAGFLVAGARLKMGFVPVAGHITSENDTPSSSTSRLDLLQWLDYYNDQKILFRCERPSDDRVRATVRSS